MCGGGGGEKEIVRREEEGWEARRGDSTTTWHWQIKPDLFGLHFWKMSFRLNCPLKINKYLSAWTQMCTGNTERN